MLTRGGRPGRIPRSRGTAIRQARASVTKVSLANVLADGWSARPLSSPRIGKGTYVGMEPTANSTA